MRNRDKRKLEEEHSEQVIGLYRLPLKKVKAVLTWMQTEGEGPLRGSSSEKNHSP
jgi:hypothetical protein